MELKEYIRLNCKSLRMFSAKVDLSVPTIIHICQGHIPTYATAYKILHATEGRVNLFQELFKEKKVKKTRQSKYRKLKRISVK